MIRVLFVDDQVAILDALKRVMFSRTEWECEFATSGADALAILDTKPFDVVISDMRMPGMDGAVLLEKVMDRHPTTIRMILTGYTELETALRVAPVAHQFLIKPCPPELLQQVVERSCLLRDRLKDERLRALIGRITNLPARPRVYAELTHALRDPNASLGDVARVIEQHPGLSAKVLQLVNSAFIGLQRRTTSVEEAVRYIGFQLIRGLVVSCEVFSVLLGDEKDTDLVGPAHSLLTGRLASRMSADRTQSDEAMTAGLLHDIGWLVMEREFPEKMRLAHAQSAKENRPLHEIEQEIIGVTQAEVGGYLLGLWGIPLTIVEAVFFHREPWTVATETFDLPGMVHLACRISHETLGAKTGRPAEQIAESDAYVHRLGLDEQMLEWRAMARELVDDAMGEAA